MILTFMDVCYGSNLYVGILVLTGFFGGEGARYGSNLLDAMSFLRLLETSWTVLVHDG